MPLQCLLFFSKRKALKSSSVMFGIFSGRNSWPYASNAAFCARTSPGLSDIHVARSCVASARVALLIGDTSGQYTVNPWRDFDDDRRRAPMTLELTRRSGSLLAGPWTNGVTLWSGATQWWIDHHTRTTARRITIQKIAVLAFDAATVVDPSRFIKAVASSALRSIMSSLAK
jgi:hypothetical protein